MFFLPGFGHRPCCIAFAIPTYPTDAADFLAPRQRTTVLHPLDYQVSRRAMEEWRAVNALHAGDRCQAPFRTLTGVAAV